MSNNGLFSRLLSEFGGVGEEEKEKNDAKEEAAIDSEPKTVITKRDIVRLHKKNMGKAAGTGKLEVRDGSGSGVC